MRFDPSLDSITASAFIAQWHYSGNVPKGRNLFFGWWSETTLFDELYAVADYGNGVNGYQASYLARLTNEPVTNDNLVELKRLARRDPREDTAPLTRFLSLCHKALKRMHGIRYVVSFSDPMHNHTGGIYKAANFTHLGQTQAEMHVVDDAGVVRHRRYPYRYAKRNGCTIAEARTALNLTRVATTPKDRWFLKL